SRTLEELVQTLDGNASTYETQGKPKAAYVARLLGISLVASKILEPRTRQRDQLLSHFIDTAAYVYITQHNAQAARSCACPPASPAPPMPTCMVRQRATRFALPTPTS